MTEKEILDLIQSRMSTSYNEQIWAVTIVSSLCGFIIVNAKKLRKTISYKWLTGGIWIITGLCFLFILSRFGIYLHYSNLLDNEIKTMTEYSWYASLCRWFVLFSGTLIYSVIIFGMNRATILICKNAYSKGNKNPLKRIKSENKNEHMQLSS